MTVYSTHPGLVALRIEPDDCPPPTFDWRRRDFAARRGAGPDDLAGEIAARVLLCAVTPAPLWPLWWLTGWSR